MRKSILIFLFSSLSVLVFSQSENEIVIGRIESVESNILNEQRKIWVHVPQNNQSNKLYPVVYLLDGDLHFNSVVGMIQQLSSVNGNAICPEMIIVGIPNTNRTRDLTPFKGDMNDPFLHPKMLKESGGGENFISFIEKELIPHIESKYPAAPYRMLIGHSLGGLTVINTLLHHNKLFSSYVAIDPSMKWGSKKLLNEFKKSSSDITYNNTALYLGIANNGKGMNMQEIKADTTLITEHTRSILELDHYLKSNPQNKLLFNSKFYENENHGSVSLITEYDALHYIFDFYRPKFKLEEFMNSDTKIVEEIVTHYENISQMFGYEIKPDEAIINGMGYKFLRMNLFENAGQLFKLNVKNYPESSNVYDSLADFYSAIGEKEKAKENYKKALTLSETDYTREKLNKLQQE